MKRDLSMLSFLFGADFGAAMGAEGSGTAEAPGSGLLAPQGVVRFKGQSGRFDDMVGRGWVLLARDPAALASLSPAHRAALQSQGSIVVQLGADGVTDVEGSYAAYLESLGAVAVLVRPDFYCHGAARTAAEVPALIDHWRTALGLAS